MDPRRWYSIKTAHPCMASCPGHCVPVSPSLRETESPLPQRHALCLCLRQLCPPVLAVVSPFPRQRAPVPLPAVSLCLQLLCPSVHDSCFPVSKDACSRVHGSCVLCRCVPMYMAAVSLCSQLCPCVHHGSCVPVFTAVPLCPIHGSCVPVPTAAVSPCPRHCPRARVPVPVPRDTVPVSSAPVIGR